MNTSQNNRGDAETPRHRKKANLSNGLLVAVGLLVVLFCWQSWNYARLKLEIAFAEEQTRIFDDMHQQAVGGSVSGTVEALAYIVNYYPTGTKQRKGSRLDNVVERARASTVRDIISELHRKTGEDLGTNAEAWIEKYAKNK